LEEGETSRKWEGRKKDDRENMFKVHFMLA
jgi:hypothetical protein